LREGPSIFMATPTNAAGSSGKPKPPLSLLCTVPNLGQDALAQEPPSELPGLVSTVSASTPSSPGSRTRSPNRWTAVGISQEASPLPPGVASPAEALPPSQLLAKRPPQAVSRAGTSESGDMSRESSQKMARLRVHTITSFSEEVPMFASAKDAFNAAALFVVRVPEPGYHRCGSGTGLNPLQEQLHLLGQMASQYFWQRSDLQASFNALLLIGGSSGMDPPEEVATFCARHHLEPICVPAGMDISKILAHVAALIPAKGEAKERLANFEGEELRDGSCEPALLGSRRARISNVIGDAICSAGQKVVMMLRPTSSCSVNTPGSSTRTSCSSGGSFLS